MVYFHTKNHNFEIFWKTLQWKILVYFTANLFICLTFGIFCDHSNVLLPFGILPPVLVCCTKKNLATLAENAFPTDWKPEKQKMSPPVSITHHLSLKSWKIKHLASYIISILAIFFT
jgi:hypothetical protein